MTIEEKFYKDHPDKKILFLMIAGSHFFDLNGPNSDKDYKGIYLPIDGKENRRGEVEYKTNPVKNSKNSAEDVDINFFSLKKFLTLLGTGDFNMVEMLYAPENKILVRSEIYDELRSIRESILVNDVSSFLGFVKKEYKRYGCDKNHLGIQVNFIDFLKKYPKNKTLADYWEDVKEFAKKDDSFVKITRTPNVHKDLDAIVVAKRMFHSTVKFEYIIEALEYNITRYGARRKTQAEAGAHLEWKGLYHALRLIYEADEIFKEGKLVLPYSEEKKKLLRSVKEGTLEDEDWLFEEIDKGIARLNDLERDTISNKKNVTHLIDKLIFIYYGRTTLQYLINLN